MQKEIQEIQVVKNLQKMIGETRIYRYLSKTKANIKLSLYKRACAKNRKKRNIYLLYNLVRQYAKDAFMKNENIFDTMQGLNIRIFSENIRR